MYASGYRKHPSYAAAGYATAGQPVGYQETTTTTVSGGPGVVGSVLPGAGYGASTYGAGIGGVGVGYAGGLGGATYATGYPGAATTTTYSTGYGAQGVGLSTVGAGYGAGYGVGYGGRASVIAPQVVSSGVTTVGTTTVAPTIYEKAVVQEIPGNT
jgi:hypothetical protein